MNKKVILGVIGSIALIMLVVVLSSSAPKEVESSSQGDFDQLVSSGNAEDLKVLSKEDSKESVSEKLKVKPEDGYELKDNEEFDYYEHYVLSNGQMYDIYYKDGKLAGATSFIE